VTENIAGVSLPSLLIVPGAWHEPDHFRPLLDELSDIDVHTVTLRSSGKDPAILGDMYADAEAIAQAAAAIDGPVVVVAHSYGGIPTTQAFPYARNVRHLIYLAAFQLHAGESLISTNGGSLMSWSRLRRRPRISDYVEPMTPATVFYNDVDTLTARRAVSQLGYQSYASMRQRLTATAWKSIPSTYVICERDNALLVATQELIAERADDVQRMSTSHSPFLSQPAELARLIRRYLACKRS
jgi:pimeloyl-ACP methyl ester carboxylesterase